MEDLVMTILLQKSWVKVMPPPEYLMAGVLQQLLCCTSFSFFQNTLDY